MLSVSGAEVPPTGAASAVSTRRTASGRGAPWLRGRMTSSRGFEATTGVRGTSRPKSVTQRPSISRPHTHVSHATGEDQAPVIPVRRPQRDNPARWSPEARCWAEITTEATSRARSRRGTRARNSRHDRAGGVPEAVNDARTTGRLMMSPPCVQRGRTNLSKPARTRSHRAGTQVPGRSPPLLTRP